MDNIYKLSFESQEAWKEVEKQLQEKTEDGFKYINAVLGTPIEVGNVPIQATFDENEKELTEASFHTDWAVDVIEKGTHSDSLMPILQDYLIEARSNYHHIIGGNFKIITK